MSALEPLLYTAPPDILESILRQFSKVLPNDAAARRIFQTTGGLKKLQEIQAQPQTEVAELITLINSYYSHDVVKYYSASSTNCRDSILNRLSQYTPQVCCHIFFQTKLLLNLFVFRTFLQNQMKLVICRLIDLQILVLFQMLKNVLFSFVLFLKIKINVLREYY